MAKRFSELRNNMSPASQKRAASRTGDMLREMPLHELRQALNLTQEEMAQLLRIKQASVSKLERRTDMYISTLARFIEAMGGQLEVNARFPEGAVTITSLEGIRLPKQRKAAVG